MKVQVPPSAPSPKPRAQRGATFVAITAVWAHWFKATHPHGVRRITSAAGFYGNWFQSTHPHGVRPEYSETEYSDTEFQSTHPHGVRPDHLPIELIILLVSIHAPSRGATMGSYFFAERSIRFNPRTLTGCDQYRPPMS